MDGYLALSANYGTLRLKNCLITSATEFSTGSSYQGWAYWSQQHDQTAFDYVFTEGATMNTEATDRAGATGNMWRMVLTSSIRSVAYPLRLPVAQFAVNASSLVTVTAWMKKSNATAVNGRLVIKAGQVAGLSTDQIATLANNTDWQQLTLTFTPTEAGVFEVETLAEYVTANGNVYIDEIEVTQA
jgi:fluoride ion exporter CrcB/FEX